MKKGKKEENKSFIEQHKKTILLVAALLVLAIGGTYAWFTLTVQGEKTTVIHAGKLSMALDESTSEGISLLNTYPLTDQEGLDTTAYTFKLTNDGTIANSYTIYLDDVTENPKKIDTTVIKYDLKKTEYTSTNSVKNAQTDTMQLLSDIQTDDGIILDTGILQPGEYNEYSLQLWMDYDAGNEYQNSGFNGQLRIVGSQIAE